MGHVGSNSIVFEQYRGAACAPPAPRYRPRQPHKTVLHQIVREHLETMLAQAALRSEDGRGYPRFSCKGRLCPSCQARRMHDLALHLCEQVIPAVPLRQWVLAVPRALRFLLARDAELRRRVVGITVRTIFMLQRRQARADGFTQVMPGAVSFLHEAGSALNLNPHTHSLVPDGVFAFEPEQPASFVELPPPAQREVEGVLATIVRRVNRLLEREAQPSEREADAELDDALAQAQARAVGPRLEQARAVEPTVPPLPEPLCARLKGFSLHAAVTVAADDMQGRLRLLRYGARPALSSERLSLLPDGRVRYQLRRKAGPGRPDALLLEPPEFLRRLAATLPRPYQHRTLYHGICACSRPSGAPRWRRKFAPAAIRRFEISPAACRARRSARHRCAGPRGPEAAPSARRYTLVVDNDSRASA